MIHVASAVAFRVMKKSLTNLAFLLPALMFPVIFFVGYAVRYQRRPAPGLRLRARLPTFQFAFVMVQSAAMAGVSPGSGSRRTSNGASRGA